MEATYPPAIESFLGTVPGMIYRSRLAPSYDVDFVSEGTTETTGYPASDFTGARPIEALGGTFALESPPGGTVVRASAPL